ncbi:MAG: trypsin-like serine protease [Xanthobacteraceae bacterium]
MVRLAAGGKAAGACTGDSGGPVFQGEKHALGPDPRVAAVIGWSTGTKDRECGLVTGATLVAQQLDWIAKTVQTLGSSLGNQAQVTDKTAKSIQ